MSFLFLFLLLLTILSSIELTNLSATCFMSSTPASIDQVVIDFMSPTCGACQEIAPVFAACAKEYPTKGVFLKVDILELEVSIYTTVSSQ